MRNIFLLSIVLFTCTCNAQEDRMSFEDSILIEIANETSDTAIISMYDILGSSLRRKEQSKSKYYWTKCLELIKKAKPQTEFHKQSKAHVFNGLGIIEKRMGNYPEALDYYFKSLSLSESLQNDQQIGTAYFNIGAIYRTIHEYDQALDYYGRSLEIRTRNENNGGIQNCYNGIGVTYRKLNELDSAIVYYKRALNLAERMMQEGKESDALQITKANALTGMAVVYQIKGNAQTSLDLYFQSLAIQQGIGNQHGIVKGLQNIGSTYSRTRNFGQAEKYLLQAYELSEEEHFTTSLADISGRLAALYSRMGRYKSAYEYVIKQAEFQAVLINKEQTKAMAVREAEFSFEKTRAADSIQNANEQLVLSAELEARNESIKRKNLQMKQERTVKYSLIIGLLIAFVAVFLIFRQYKVIGKEKKRSEELLHNILPVETAEELKRTGYSQPKPYESVTVIFTDFKGFTMLAEKLSPKELVEELDYCFKNFDRIIGKYRIEKIKTIGDAYMAVAGLPEAYKDNAKEAVAAALEMRDFMLDYQQKRESEGRLAFEMRIGLHSGQVVAGIVGTKKFAYDIWGDTVNTASRMESSGEPGKVNVSGVTREQLGTDFFAEFRGKIEAKNKGKIDMFFIEQEVG